MRGLQGWRRAFGMMGDVIFKRFIPQDELESPHAVRIDGSLQVEVFEGNRMLNGFLADCFHHLEMELAVHDPVVDHGENRAIFQEEAGIVLSSIAVHIHLRLCRLRRVTDWARGVHGGVVQGPKPELVTIPTSPPAGIRVPEGIAEDIQWAVYENHRWTRTDRMNRPDGR